MIFSHRLDWLTPENTWASILQETNVQYDLTISNPTQVFDLSPWRENLLSSLVNANSLVYEPHPKGLASTRAFLSKAISPHLSPEDIILTASTSEAYAFLFKLLCNPGDEVLVPIPGYPLFEYLAKLEVVKTIPYTSEYIHGRGYEIDFDSIVSSLSPKTRAIVLIHPNNPTGHGIREKEITQLEEIAQSHDLALIVDEVFSDYWTNRPADVPSSLLGHTYVPTFILGGLSKSLLLPQMKLSWIIVSAPPSIKPTILHALELIGDTYLSPSIPIQLALPSWWKIKPEMQTIVSNRLQENIALLTNLLHNTPCRLQTLHGGWTAVIEIPRLLPEEQLIITLLRSFGVKIFPGYFFDFPQEGHIIVSLLTPLHVMKEGIEALLLCLHNASQ